MRFKEKDGISTPWRMLPIGIIYNTEVVKSVDRRRKNLKS